jgi:hypothetical protein
MPYKYGCMGLLFFVLVASRPSIADPVPVRLRQGTFHGFLVLKTVEGRTIASGDLIQVVHGELVQARLTFRFRDGSLDDEATVFSQNKAFRLIRDHHVQRGPSYPKPMDMSVDAASGEVIYRDEHGTKTKQHMDLPEDLTNGLLLTLLLNIDPAAPPVRLPYLAPAGKPRMVHIAIAAEGDEPVSIGGISRKATNFRIHIELGGVVGLIAPILGKEPSDLHFWILRSTVPAFVKGSSMRAAQSGGWS